jgi:hypothetical protein
VFTCRTHGLRVVTAQGPANTLGNPSDPWPGEYRVTLIELAPCPEPGTYWLGIPGDAERYRSEREGSVPASPVVEAAIRTVAPDEVDQPTMVGLRPNVWLVVGRSRYVVRGDRVVWQSEPHQVQCPSNLVDVGDDTWFIACGEEGFPSAFSISAILAAAR